MNNYPLGTEHNPDAPWNQKDLPEKEIEVTVSVTLSKVVKITVDDYEVEEDIDEDGMCVFYNFSDCDLNKAVNEQVLLPHEVSWAVENAFNNCLSLKAVGMTKELRGVVEEGKDWYIDDIEITKD